MLQDFFHYSYYLLADPLSKIFPKWKFQMKHNHVFLEDFRQNFLIASKYLKLNNYL